MCLQHYSWTLFAILLVLSVGCSESENDRLARVEKSYHGKTIGFDACVQANNQANASAPLYHIKHLCLKRHEQEIAYLPLRTATGGYSCVGGSCAFEVTLRSGRECDYLVSRVILWVEHVDNRDKNNAVIREYGEANYVSTVGDPALEPSGFTFENRTVNVTFRPTEDRVGTDCGDGNPCYRWGIEKAYGLEISLSD